MLQGAISFPVDVNRGGSPSFYDSIPFNALFMVALSYRILIYFHLPFTTRPSVGCFSFSSHCPIGRSECMPKREQHVTRYGPIGQGWGYWQHEVSPSAMGHQSPGRKSHLSPLSHTPTPATRLARVATHYQLSLQRHTLIIVSTIPLVNREQPLNQ